MNSMLAYEIGGVFLLCALLMYGTVGGFTPGFLRNSRYLPIFVALGLAAWGCYRAAPQFASWVATLGEDPKPVAAPVVEKAKPVRHAIPAAHAAEPRFADDTVAHDIEPPERIIVAPAPVAEPESESEAPRKSEGKVKHAAKAVGRFLHVVPRREAN